MKKKIAFMCSIMLSLSLAVTIIGSAGGNFKTDVSTATAEVYMAENEESTTSSIGNMVGEAVSGIGGGAAGMLGDVVSNVAGGMGSGDSSGGIGDILGGIGSGDSSGGIGDALGSIGSGSSGSIGDALGSVGSGSSGGLLDSLGGILGGLGGSDSSGTTAVTYNTGYIDPIPAATQNYDLGSSLLTQAPATQAQNQQSATPATTYGETVDYAATSNPYQKPEGEFVAGDEGDGIKWLQWIFIYTHYGLRDDGITGVLDTDTVAVVKKLQQEKGLTIDGNVNADVINAAEVLYYEYTFGVEESAQANVSVAPSGENNPTDDNSEKNNDALTIIVIVIAIIWIIAITVILVLFILKKKRSKKTKKDDNIPDSQESQSKKADEKNKGMSLSDLFEEANKD